MAIPKGLEDLILAGKAKPDLLTHVGGSFGTIDVDPDKLMIIYNVKIFPFLDFPVKAEEGEGGVRYKIDMSSPRSRIYTLNINSEASREVLPFKFQYSSTGEHLDNEPGVLLGDTPIDIPLYSIHRSKVTFDLRIFDLVWSKGTIDKISDPANAQQQPFGPRQENAIKTIDPLGNYPFGPVPNFVSDLWKNKADVSNHSDLNKFEIPSCDITQIVDLLAAYTTIQRTSDIIIPILHFSVVFANSSNFDKILSR